MSNKTQEFIDAFYLKHGKCCAGCDWWRWHNAAVGDCTRSAPVSGKDRVSMIGMVSCSLEVSGHIMTKRDHVCGEFVDTYDWGSK